MINTIWTIQIITAILLILLVLLHSPKGDGIGAMDGSANLFSSQKSAEKGLNHITYILAIIFGICSFITGFNLIH